MAPSFSKWRIVCPGFCGVGLLDCHAAVPHGGRHRRRGYPAEFRQRVLKLIASGRRVADVARDLDICDQTVYDWRHQDRADPGIEPGLT